MERYGDDAVYICSHWGLHRLITMPYDLASLSLSHTHTHTHTLTRSEEHTSDLHSLSTRHSPDLDAVYICSHWGLHRLITMPYDLASLSLSHTHTHTHTLTHTHTDRDIYGDR